MKNEEIIEKIKNKFGEEFSFDEAYEMLNVIVSKDKLISLLEFLRDEETLQCNFLTDLCGMHFPDNKGKELGVVYMVHCWTNNIRIRIKLYVSLQDAHVPSISAMYNAANWMERETYDFYGIIFDGHTDLRRIMNEDSMDYFPQRKEYHLEDGTRTDKDDRFFGRDGHEGQQFDKRYIKS